jgi:hypothetical protein
VGITPGLLALRRSNQYTKIQTAEEALAAEKARVATAVAPKKVAPPDLEPGQARNIEAIQNVIDKLEGEKGGLARHLEDVRREKAGEVVSRKSGGDPHSHIDEITLARKSLQTRVERLKNSLNAPGHSAEVRAYVEEQIRQTEAIIKQMTEALGK